jgi:hypothetical protein
VNADRCALVIDAKPGPVLRAGADVLELARCEAMYEPVQSTLTAQK